MSDKIQKDIVRLIRPEIRALEAYSVPPAQGLIKLDAMENPYSWPAEMTEAWLRVLRTVALNRYPDPRAAKLKQHLCAAMHIPKDNEVILGNGSDELIQIILLALAAPGRYVMAPAPTFVMYELLAAATGLGFIGVPLTADFELNMPAMLAAIKKHKPAVIFLAYPNNPTGNLFAVEEIEDILRASDGLVVVDEAYHAFAGVSFIERLREFDNLLVMRTLSKQGLAALRLGLLVGAPAWLAEFDKVRLPYNINSLTQASAEFALNNPAFLQTQAARLRADREQLFLALKSIPGMQPWPSRANFILFRAVSRSAAEVFAGLLKQGILIKNLDRSHALLTGCLRVTVGTPEENRMFLQALGSI